MERRLAVAVLAACVATPSLAGPVPDYGHDFVVIGDPGNRPANQEEGPWFYPPFSGEGARVGDVDYRYRMSRTEVTVGQWLEFVNAYAPYHEGPLNTLRFTGQWIVYDSGEGRYRAIPGTENYSTNMGWRYAARYCNWLHNDKGLDRASFEDGAYDTLTFTDNPDGSFNDQIKHSPDARFWIPTLDEWTKGMHWDPAANGDEGGYWRYPHSSNLEPTVGAPGEGETNAGTGAFYDVGSYGDAMSPWGLLDGSGGESEWLEDVDITLRVRSVRGSSWALPVLFDPIDYVLSGSPISLHGFRVASVVPTPTPLLAGAVLGGWLVTVRKRRSYHV